jgi:hypothetical protein
MGVGPYSRLLCGQRCARDCLPDLESVLQLLPIGGRGKPMPARAEVLRDGAIGGQKSLGVARGFELLHTPLPLTSGLMRVLRPTVEIPVLAMFDSWQDLALGGSIALEFVGDDHSRHVG